MTDIWNTTRIFAPGKNSGKGITEKPADNGSVVIQEILTCFHFYRC